MSALDDVHIAILPSPGMGHLLPLLRFANHLVSLHGIRATLLLLTTGASPAQSQLLNFEAPLDGLHFVNLPPIDDVSPADAAGETRLSIIIRDSIPSLRSTLAAMPENTLLVIDIFGTDVFDVAVELSMPKYVFFTSTAMALSLLLYLPTLDQEVRGEYVDLFEPLQIPGCDPIPVDHLMDPMEDRKNERYRWILHHSSRYPMADGILINSCEALEPVSLSALRENPILRRIPTPNVYPVGPIVDSSSRDPLLTGAEYCLRWLDAQPPSSVLYVSFGSGGTLSEEQTTELAYGLELSQQRFIWVVREPTGNDTSGAFFTCGAENESMLELYLPDGFLARTKEVGLVLPSWAPQIEILRHTSIAGFLTHCGWNSTLESIVHGVPMIVWPLYAEQKMNAFMLTKKLKVALSPEVEAWKALVKRSEIERVVKIMMDGEEGKLIRKRIKELKQQVLRDFDKGGSSYESLHQLIAEWKTSSQTMKKM